MKWNGALWDYYTTNITNALNIPTLYLTKKTNVGTKSLTWQIATRLTYWTKLDNDSRKMFNLRENNFISGNINDLLYLSVSTHVIIGQFNVPYSTVQPAEI